MHPPSRRPRLLARSVAVLVLALLALALPAAGTAGAAPTRPAVSDRTSTSGAPLPPARGSIVVDADTGDVWSSHALHQPMLVASTIKLLTALIVHDRLDPNGLVGVSFRAASMPARKMSLLPGEHWKVRDLLRTMLLASANDSAVALAEKFGGGTPTGFVKTFAEEAQALGLRDKPTLVDPAGLDDESSVRGGNRISAYDLAIVARAFLHVPELAGIVRMPEYRFRGGDGQAHVVTNHNRFLQLYSGAIGMKTGATAKSGHSLVAAAQRGGHTLIAVVIDSPSPYQQAAELLDAAFLHQAAGDPPLGRLSEGPAPTTTTTSSTTTTAAPATSTTTSRPAAAGGGSASAGGGAASTGGSGSSDATGWAAAAFGVAVVLLLAGIVYRRRVVRTARARR